MGLRPLYSLSGGIVVIRQNLMSQLIQTSDSAYKDGPRTARGKRIYLGIEMCYPLKST